MLWLRSRETTFRQSTNERVTSSHMLPTGVCARDWRRHSMGRAAVDFRDSLRRSPSSGVTPRSTNLLVGEPGGSRAQPTDSQALRKTVSKLVSCSGSCGSMMKRQRQTEVLHPIPRLGNPGAGNQNSGAWRVREGVHDAGHELDARRRQVVQFGLELLESHVVASRRAIRSTYAGLRSMPIHLRPRFLAATSVVPDPA